VLLLYTFVRFKNIIVLCGRRIISRILKQLSVFNIDSRNVCLVLKFTYEERLKFLGWPTLELRRLHTDLIWSYKNLFELVHLNSDHFFKLSSNQTRGHGFKLYKQFSSTVHSSFFAQRVVNVWNSLPTSVDFSKLSAFKRSLQRVNLNEFLTVYKFSDMYVCV